MQAELIFYTTFIILLFLLSVYALYVIGESFIIKKVQGKSLLKLLVFALVLIIFYAVIKDVDKSYNYHTTMYEVNDSTMKVVTGARIGFSDGYILTKTHVVPKLNKEEFLAVKGMQIEWLKGQLEK